MVRSTVPRAAWAAAAVLLVAGTAGAQPIPTSGTTTPKWVQPMGGAKSTQPGTGLGTGTKSSQITPATGRTLSDGLGGTTGGGFGGGNGAGMGFGGLPRLSPEMEAQVMMEALMLAEMIADTFDMQFASEFDALLLFLQAYEMRYMAAVKQMMTAGGTSGFGSTTTRP